MFNKAVYKDILGSNNVTQLVYLMSVLLDEAMDKCAFPHPTSALYEEMDKAMEVGKKIMSLRPWNDVDSPPAEGENIEVIWCNQPSEGYYEDGMFKIDAWVPIGFGFADEGSYYKKVVRATAWRRR